MGEELSRAPESAKALGEDVERNIAEAMEKLEFSEGFSDLNEDEQEERRKAMDTDLRKAYATGGESKDEEASPVGAAA